MWKEIRHQSEHLGEGTTVLKRQSLGLALWLRILSHPPVILASHTGTWFMPGVLHFKSSSLLMCLGKQQRMIQSLSPCTHAGGGSWLQTSPVLDIVAIWGVISQIKKISLSPKLLSNKYLKIKKSLPLTI